MTEPRTEPRWQTVVMWLLVAATVVVFIAQCHSLFIFPQPNSLRWFGDETWVLSEAREQITTGIVRYPLAIGSTLEHGKGLVLSMTWLSSLLYGLPSVIVGGDMIAVGRVVTAILSAILLGAVYVMSRKLGAARWAAACAMLLLVSSRSFFFSSHSARPDILAGLIVLLFVAYGVREIWQQRSHDSSWWFGFGTVVALLSFTSSIHLLTLLTPVAIFLAIRLGAIKRMSSLISLLAGGVCALGALVLVYYFTVHSLTLFAGGAEKHAQFQDVLTSIPILRPFSRSVQMANILIRLKQFAGEAPAAFLLPIVAVTVWRRRSGTHTLAIATIIVLLSWLLLQGAEINYLIHILPLLFVAIAVGLTRFEVRYAAVGVAASIIAAMFFILALKDSYVANENASMIDASNANLVSSIESAIVSDSTSHNYRVLTEPVALARLTNAPNLHVMTDHFISFPISEEPLDSFLNQERVKYIVLYNSPTYPKNRPRDDPFYRDVERTSELIGRYNGRSGDIGRDYFDRLNWMDTLLLFKHDLR